MFTRQRNFVKSDKVSPNLFVEGDEIFSSELMHKIDKCTDREMYMITKYEHRADLVAKDIYGDESYSWMLLYMNRIGVEDLVRNRVLTYILKSQLDSIIDSL